MIEALLPSSVTVVTTRAERPESSLFPEERETVRRAVDARRREFATARACAREALARLGVGAVGIPSGDRGEPVWPPGIIGSITHCEGYRACAVARAGEVRSIGIDAEPAAPLPDGVLGQVAFGGELEMLRRVPPAACWDRVLFSAKESIYKAWYPLAQRWLGFEDVELTIRPDGSFTAPLLVAGPDVDGRPLTRFEGRWAVSEGLVGAAVIVGGPA